MKLQALSSISVSLCVCVCLTIIFGQKLTSERKHAEFIIMIQIDHMPIILGAAKDATKGQWGVHSVFLWGQTQRGRVTDRTAVASQISCIFNCQLNSMHTLKYAESQFK